MDVVVIKANIKDAEAILAYSQVVGGESDNLSFGPAGIPFTVEQEQAYLSSLNGNPKNALWLAKVSDEIVGMANYRTYDRKRTAHRGEFGISVKKAYWGNGIGSLLMSTVLAHAENVANAEIVSLEVRSDNLRAIRLYQKFEFTKIGTFKGYFKIDGVYVDFDIMEKFIKE